LRRTPEHLALACLLALALAVVPGGAQAPQGTGAPPSPQAAPAAAAPAASPSAAPEPVPPPAPPIVETLQLGRFGKFPVYRPPGTPAQVAVLLSPDLRAPAATATAAALTALGTLVIGVDSTHYARAIAAGVAGKAANAPGGGRCAYAAADFETLGHCVEEKLGLADYLPPVLVGEGGASSLTYATLAQSPPNTFAGAITTGFCRVLAAPKGLCPGEGLHWEEDYKGPGLMLRPHALENPWVVLGAAPLPGCGSTGAAEFVPQVKGAQILPAGLPAGPAGQPAAEAERLGAAFAIVAARSRQERAAQAARSEDIRDLPVVEMPAPHGAGPARRTLMVIVSGDGGWVGLDRRLADRINGEQGVPVVGLNSLQYFWKARTPESAAADLARLLDHYLPAWGLSDAIVLGYSQGADVVPFMVDRLPVRLRSRVRLVVIVGPSPGASFDYNFGTYMSCRKPRPELPVKPAIARLRGMKVMCVYGNREKDSLCRTLDPKVAAPLELNTGHGFARQNGVLLASILDVGGLKPVQGKPAGR